MSKSNKLDHPFDDFPDARYRRKWLLWKTSWFLLIANAAVWTTIVVAGLFFLRFAT